MLRVPQQDLEGLEEMQSSQSGGHSYGLRSRRVHVLASLAQKRSSQPKRTWVRILLHHQVLCIAGKPHLLEGITGALSRPGRAVSRQFEPSETCRCRLRQLVGGNKKNGQSQRGSRICTPTLETNLDKTLSLRI